MRDFFAVSHKYRLAPSRVAHAQLFTKSWHLNDAIKKILLQNYQPEPSVYHIVGDTLYVQDTDTVSSNLLNLNAGDVSNDLLDLDR